MAKSMRLDTRLVHAGEPHPRLGGAVSMPIFQTSTFAAGADETDYHELRYLRLNNTPNHDALHRKLAALEGSEAALVTASGMAAISTTLLTVLRPGDHIITQRCLYGGTHDLLTGELRQLGFMHTFVDGDDPHSWHAALTPETRAIYCETLTNPLVEMADLPAFVQFARDHGLTSIIDNTFTSPVNFRPSEHGFDLVLESATKYLNGHSDIVAGVVAGSAETIENIRRRLNHLGGTLDPHACFLLHRGLKTLGVRVRHQNASALTLASALREHRAVASVRYPGLDGDPSHARARELLDGFGGMLAVELHGGAEAAQKLIAGLTLGIHAPSLGGPETLVGRPAAHSHAAMDPEARRELGITDGLIRVSVGLEDERDLVDDFLRALDSL